MVLAELLSNPAVAAGLISLAVLVAAYQAIVYIMKKKSLDAQARVRPNSPQTLEKGIGFSKTSMKDRKPGTWKPMDVKFPAPKPLTDWSVTDTKPLHYRPFKHNYFVTMGIRSLDYDDWIQLDNDWLKFHNRKLERLEQENADELYAMDPVAEDATLEALELLVDYLPARYPTLFKRTAVGIDNIVTGESFDTTTKPYKEHPLVVAAKLIQDDIAIMIEGTDGLYYLKAGAVLLAGFWRLKDKVNMPLYQIHTSGDVPYYKEKLQTPMDRFFTKLLPDKGVVRNNYFIQTDDDVAWSHAIGPENSDRIGWYTADNAVDPERLMFRSERQSLRRLPRSGAILFTIRTYFLPVAQIAKEPYVPRRLLNGIKAWDDPVSVYKGLEKYKDVLLPYLEQKAEEQEAQGYLPESEEKNYPY